MRPVVGQPRSVPLSDRDRSLLDFERSWWTEPGPKETAIAERFGMTTEEYMSALMRLIDDADAATYDALVVRRMQRMRDRRRQARTSNAATATS